MQPSHIHTLFPCNPISCLISLGRRYMLTLKGPLGGKYYLHAVIGQYSKFPEVDLVSSASFKKLKPILDRIFSTHHIPDSFTTDNGPPYSSDEMAEYAKEMGFKLLPVSPEDPQCNGFAENFVKFLCKLLHTASVEGKDPRAELYKYLLHYRATHFISFNFVYPRYPFRYLK